MDITIRCSKCTNSLKATGLEYPIDWSTIIADMGWEYDEKKAAFICSQCKLTGA